MDGRAFVIAQLSDLHCGSPCFDGSPLDAAVGGIVNAMFMRTPAS